MQNRKAAKTAAQFPMMHDRRWQVKRVWNADRYFGRGLAEGLKGGKNRNRIEMKRVGLFRWTQRINGEVISWERLKILDGALLKIQNNSSSNGNR